MVIGMMDFANLGRRRTVNRDWLLFDEKYVVLDTELTGLDEKKDSIVSIGAVRMHGGSIALGDTFYRLLKPETVFEWLNRMKNAFEKLNIPLKYTLYDLATYFGIAVKGSHNALADTFITAQIFQRLLPMLIGSGMDTVGKLVGARKLFAEIDWFRSGTDMYSF
jgi:DNA polymerase III epsilon subunit-like protein